MLGCVSFSDPKKEQNPYPLHVFNRVALPQLKFYLDCLQKTKFLVGFPRKTNPETRIECTWFIWNSDSDSKTAGSKEKKRQRIQGALLKQPPQWIPWETSIVIPAKK